MEIHNDEPTTSDLLGRKVVAKTLASFIAECSPPYTLAIYGTWGSGKTSFMMLIDDELRQHDAVFPVWFNAWKFQFDEHPVVGLLHAVARDCGVADEIDVRNTLAAVALAFSEKVPTPRWVPRVSDIAKAKSKLHALRHQQESARTNLDVLLDRFVALALKKGRPRATEDPSRGVVFVDRSADWARGLAQLNEEVAPPDADRRIVVFVDDIDRCTAERGLSVLEALKIYINKSRVVFVVGLDRAAIEAGVRTVFPAFDQEAEQYLDKLVQFDFALPRLGGTSARHLIATTLTSGLSEMSAESDETRQRVVSTLTAFLDPNPRDLKRMAGALVHMDRLARMQLQDDYHVSIMAILVFLQHRHREIYRAIRMEPSRFVELFVSASADQEDHLRIEVDRDRVLGEVCSGLPERLREGAQIFVYAG